MAWNVYLLSSSEGGSYVGATVNLDHRLRQHNGEISGGAKATSGRAGSWRRVCHVEGFADECAALQFEWAWKYWTKKFKGGFPVERRIKALCGLIGSPRATSKAVPFASLENPLIFVIEDESVGKLWMRLADTVWDHFIVEIKDED
jgi:structure-specific endonuclease subunit SLX1